MDEVVGCNCEDIIHVSQICDIAFILPCKVIDSGRLQISPKGMRRLLVQRIKVLEHESDDCSNFLENSVLSAINDNVDLLSRECDSFPKRLFDGILAIARESQRLLTTRESTAIRRVQSRPLNLCTDVWKFLETRFGFDPVRASSYKVTKFHCVEQHRTYLCRVPVHRSTFIFDSNDGSLKHARLMFGSSFGTGFRGRFGESKGCKVGHPKVKHISAYEFYNVVDTLVMVYTYEDSAVRLAKFNYKRTAISEVNDGATLRAPSINEGEDIMEPVLEGEVFCYKNALFEVQSDILGDDQCLMCTVLKTDSTDNCGW
eukprot:CAMPEP_0196802828 /NCGR_PEP_ID=MMETSP1362-20130617/2376_1 /TAXON_ID=163516 /ORGANISM="Leptocylindrus danicus, Strain CCMP1856" /LENGTH=314 /DNA_ID=CAMNT_0042174231 /DNA_START=415 /DNA_END=1356 /DNA_ORIENTATION=+